MGHGDFGLRIVYCYIFIVVWNIAHAVFCNSWHVRNLIVMVLRLNKTLKYHELIPTTECSGLAPTIIPIYSQYFTACVSSTLPEMTPFCYPKFSCWKKFTLDSWGLKHIKIHHPEQLQDACQKNQTFLSALRLVKPTQCREITPNNGSPGDLHVFSELRHLEFIGDLVSQPPPAALL
jgi:hypothetical protein